jgi:hypothetical protein
MTGNMTASYIYLALAGDIVPLDIWVSGENE